MRLLLIGFTGFLAAANAAANAATVTWTGAGSTDLNAAANWSSGTVPASGDTLQWNGTQAGDLALTFSGSVGKSSGYLFDLTPLQTGSLSMVNSGSASANFRMAAGASVSVASGAGAFTIGTSGTSSPVQVVLGSSGASGTNSYTFLNNSAQAATIGRNVTMTRGGSIQDARLVFDGTGDWNVAGVVSNLNAGAIEVVGSGTVTLSGINTTGTWGVLVKKGTLSVDAAAGLGSGSSSIQLGNGANAGTLTFTGSTTTTIGRRFLVGTGTASSSDGGASINAAGSAAIVLPGTGGVFNDPATATVARSLTLTGTSTAANAVTGAISDNGGATVSVVKDAAGTWVLSGSNAFSGGVTHLGGTLKVGNDAALGSGLLTIRASADRLQSADAGGRTIGNAVSLGATSVTLGAAGTGDMTFTGGWNWGSLSKTVNVDGITVTYSGTFGGDGSTANIFKGTGGSTSRLILTGDRGPATKIIEIGSGIAVRVTSNEALGTSGSNQAVVLGGTASGVLELDGGITLARTVSVEGRASGSMAAVRNVAGANVVPVLTIAAGGPDYPLEATSGTLTVATLAGVTSGSRTITVAGSGDTVIAASIPAFTGGIIKSGSGRLTLSGSNAFTGPVEIVGGTLVVTGSSPLDGRPNVSLSSSSSALDLSGLGSSTLAIGSLAGVDGSTIALASKAIQVTAASGTTTFAGTISGAGGGLVKNGDATLVLSGSSSYTGPTTINTGMLLVRHANALGSSGGTTTIAGQTATGRLGLQGGVDLVEPIIWNGRSSPAQAIVNIGDSNMIRGTLTLGSGGTEYRLESQAGLLTVASNLTGVSSGSAARMLVVDGSGDTLIAGRIANGNASNPLSLAKEGIGTLTLTGSSSYTGATSVNGGRLAVDGVIHGGGVVVATGGTLAGTGTVGAATTIGSGATLSPGESPGTLTFTDGLRWNSGGSYDWQMLSGTGAAGISWDLASVSGTLAIDATSADPFRINLWTLSGVAPDVNGPATGFDPTQNHSWTIASAGGGITGFAAERFMINVSATNGTGGFANAVDGGTFSLAQSGNDLNLVFTASASPPIVITIDVASGTQTQSQAGYPLLSGTLPVLKTGSGTLVIDQANTLTGSTTIQGGVLQLADPSALGGSVITPLAGGTVAVAADLQTSVGGLRPNAGGLVDVGNGLVTVVAGLPAADMLTALVAGRGDGSWNGTTGITSSAAAADIAASIPRTAGWLDNGDGTVTFAFAAAGDTNLDWNVDILDAANFLAGGKFDSGEPASWNEGDFGYDGMVDILDAADFLSTGLFDAGAYNPVAGGPPMAVVPEPALGGCVVIFAAVALIPARRRASTT
jgi:fibronectin-binding autotransporter adhesin